MEFFEIFAECSIAFAGFGAVHAALRGSTGARGVYRAWTVVTQGALAFVLSVLPLVLALAPMSDESLWRTASVFGVAGTAATAYSFVALDARLSHLGFPPQVTFSLRCGQAAALSAIAAMLGNLFAWPWPPGPLPYAVGLVLVLTAGLVALLASFLLPLQLALGGEKPRAPSDPPAV